MLAVYGGISVGALTSFLGYANQYAKPFNEISGVVTELQNALVHGLLVSVDSLSQLDTLGRLNRGGKVMVRFNPGIGPGITPRWSPQARKPSSASRRTK